MSWVGLLNLPVEQPWAAAAIVAITCIVILVLYYRSPDKNGYENGPANYNFSYPADPYTRFLDREGLVVEKVQPMTESLSVLIPKKTASEVDTSRNLWKSDMTVKKEYDGTENDQFLTRL